MGVDPVNYDVPTKSCFVLNEPLWWVYGSIGSFTYHDLAELFLAEHLW